MMDFSKSLESERDRVTKLFRRYERFIKKEFLLYLNTLKSEGSLREFRQLLEAGNLTDAAKFADENVLSFVSVLPNIFTFIGVAEAKAIDQALPVKLKQKVTVPIKFDPTLERAMRVMLDLRNSMANDFRVDQQEALSHIISTSYGAGASIKQSLDHFKRHIGLSVAQLRSLDNYAKLISTNSIDALNRALRDRRFDRTIINAASRNVILSSAMQQRMLDRYRERLLQNRVNVIAKTSALSVLNLARHEALQQAFETTGLDESSVSRRWNTSMDGLARDSHRSMHRQVRGLNEPFVSGSGELLMFPGDPSAPATERLNCRCSVITSFGTK